MSMKFSMTPFSSIEMLTLTFKFQKLQSFDKDWPYLERIRHRKHAVFLLDAVKVGLNKLIVWQ